MKENRIHAIHLLFCEFFTRERRISLKESKIMDLFVPQRYKNNEMLWF